MLDAAIARARSSGELADDSPLLTWPSARRRLSARIASWTEGERHPTDQEKPEDLSTPQEWAVFGHYRALLDELGVEDDEGAAVWASRRLERQVRQHASKFATVTVFDPLRRSLAVVRALRYFEASAQHVRVLLAYHSDAHLADVYGEAATLRDALLREGYSEHVIETDAEHPIGLTAVTRELFRDDAHRRPLIEQVEGLKLLCGPEGEGSALLIAREITHLVTEQGVPREEILVLTRGGEENRDVLVETLRAWGLPVSDYGRASSFSRDPAIGLLLMAMQLPVDDWDTAQLIRLLHHGCFRPDWEPGNSAKSRARAASLVRESGVFRGRPSIRAAFERRISDCKDIGQRREAIAARDVVARVIAVTEVMNQPGRWSAHFARLRALANALGLAGPGLASFWDALEEYANVAQEVVESLTYSDFLHAILGLVDEGDADHDTVIPGSIVVTTVENAAGAEGRWVFLTDLAEGTFPRQDAVKEAERDEDPARVGPAYAREMARFLRVIESAREGVVLVYPTRDEKGQEALLAGFLDGLIQKIAPDALRSIHEKHERLHPALIGERERNLAGAPGEARVQALALACLNIDLGALEALAKDPRHRPYLEGSASALRLATYRFANRDFNIYDGRIDASEAPHLLAERFGPEFRFSASQLESYAFCRFQFFMRYVLGLKALVEKEEMDEDFIKRGNDIHKMLEDIEQRRKQQSGDVLEMVDIVLRAQMSAELSLDSDADTLQQIEMGQLRRILLRYANQARSYEGAGVGHQARPESFEVEFGKDLTFLLGQGADAVQVRGIIDRVDTVEAEGKTGFRVIDYKTGRPPADKEVRELLMVQLPLYALAVERLKGAEGGGGVVDMGYWNLREDGFKPVKLDWSEVREQLESTVLGIVRQIRQGRFEINPRTSDCTSKCDFKSVCRIGQVRAVGKQVEGEPR